MKPHLAALTLLVGPLCTAADENIKVDALKQNNPDLASIPNLVCLLLLLLVAAYKLRKRMLTATTTAFPQLTRESQSGSVVTSLDQFSCSPNTPRHVEAKKKLDKSMAIGWGIWNAQHPRHRLLDALYGYRRYHERQKAEVDRFEGLYKHVSRAQRSLLEHQVNYSKKFTRIDALLKKNQELCDAIVQNAMNFYGIDEEELQRHISAAQSSGRLADKISVSQALKHYVRDWTEEGESERKETFACLVKTLQGLFPVRDDESPVKILVPGSGLGRLGHDIAGLGGFEVTVNEWSMYMNIAYRFIEANRAQNTHSFHPFIDGWSHHATESDMIRELTFPDTSLNSTSVVLTEGDFTTVFNDKTHYYDIIVTYFFIDTARNLMSYLDTIKKVLKPGGHWVNLGPLLYGTGPFVQLTLEEIVQVTEAMGFEYLETDESCGPLTFEGRTLRSMEAVYGFNNKALTKTRRDISDTSTHHVEHRVPATTGTQPNAFRNASEVGQSKEKTQSQSGLGLRYRFNDGIAARGKFVGKSLPIIDGVETHSAKTASASVSSCKRQNDPFRASGYETVEQYPVEIDTTAEEEHEIKDLVVSNQVPISIDWGLDHVDPKSRFCLGYFSNNIAQLIAVINMGFNGYRDIVLPRAETDPLVRKAVLLVVEQHLSLQNGTAISLDPAAYGSLVRELIMRSHQCAPQDDDSALTALLLLHIREMISGSDNFKLIYGSLRVVVNALAKNAGERTSDLRRFLQMQILRVCLFGESLFNETNGVHFIQAQQQACLEFITWCDRFHPELKDLLSQLASLTTWACDIYVQRAIFNPPPSETVPMIERFKQSLGQVDAYVDIVGRHLLAWPYFIVAAESSTPDHREFFLDKLVKLHNTTGCWNLLRAIDQVKEIWASQSSIRWTSLLGGPTQAFIM
ncbi:trehalase [Fusarium mundagurra]|uniref:Trehalase n=1 Tax=Fusarium mundagurra TaxID=1567541 RepID=A0A8H5YPC1_9HYPO|nr:trehalase [Fusarium mundagurra]